MREDRGRMRGGSGKDEGRFREGSGGIRGGKGRFSGGSGHSNSFETKMIKTVGKHLK